MDDEVDPKFLTPITVVTQNLLGEHIRKPVLAEKYLLKPPFRFLHEIFTNVIDATGFMKTTFSKNELKYDKITNVEEKRSFLKKAIDAIEQETGTVCDVRPSKILSGKEADKTNEMLQLLAKAITSFSSKSDKEIVSKEINHTTVKKSVESKSKPISKTAVITDDAKRARTRPIPSTQNKRLHKPDNKEMQRTLKLKKPQETVAKLNAEKEKVTDNLESSYQNDNENKLKSNVTKQSLTTLADSKASRESLRGKSDNKVAALPKKKSSTNLSTTKSKQSLISKPISSSPSSISTARKDSKENAKASAEELANSYGNGNHSSKQQESPKCTAGVPDPTFEEIAHVHTKLETEFASNEFSASKSSLPPETNQEIPLTRPVTRTRYRQKNDSSSKESSKEKNQSESTAKKKTVSQSSLHDQATCSEVPEAQAENPQDNISTTSDDGVTEEMNHKISEWKSTSANSSVDTNGNVPCKSGWILQSEENDKDKNIDLSTVNKVFQSRENITDSSIDKNAYNQPASSVESAEAFLNLQKKTQFPVFTRPITVILDNEDDEDDDETFLVQERLEADRDFTLDRLQDVLMNTASDMSHIPSEQRGLLVNQILETQRELEQLASQKTIFGNLQNELADRDKEAMREVYLRQIEDLKVAIQKMAKCANPLANIIQRSQDDACLMEIEFRKLSQEDERLQRSIACAKAETIRTLCPLTEELAQLDSRIEKMEGAIVLAKQRLNIMDEEYYYDHIYPIGQCQTPEESESEKKIAGGTGGWEFARGATSDEDEGRDSNKPKLMKSLVSVFQRAVHMHENEEKCGNFEPVTSQSHLQVSPPIWFRHESKLDKSNVRMRGSGLLNCMQTERPVWGDNRKERKPIADEANTMHNQVPFAGYSGEVKERLLAKDIKPPWWD